ncbi:MAG: MlaD family protein [Solirubrobacteraceae bacterium]
MRRRSDEETPRSALVGVVVALAMAGIGVLSFTVNTGLPWDGAYRVTALVPDAAHLIRGAEVRVHGVRVGVVSAVDVDRGRRASRPLARLELRLEEARDLPVDSTVQVRPASLLGLTFVDLRPGDAGETIPDGGTLDASRSRPTVELDDVFGMFDREFSGAVRGVTRQVGGGSAGRGAGINDAFAGMPELLAGVRALSRTLAAPSTGLARLLTAWERLADELLPSSAGLPELVLRARQTLGAMARARTALGATLEEAPPTADVVVRALRGARPALGRLGRLATGLQAASGRLDEALRGTNRALGAGDRAMRSLIPLERPLRLALGDVESLARDPATDGSLRKLHAMAGYVNTTLDELLPAQLQCNVIALWGTTVGSSFAARGTGEGPSALSIYFTTLGGEGELVQNARPSRGTGINPIPHANHRECESNNEPWPPRALNNPPGLQSNRVRMTQPPPGVRRLAERAGLLEVPEGAP